MLRQIDTEPNSKISLFEVVFSPCCILTTNFLRDNIKRRHIDQRHNDIVAMSQKFSRALSTPCPHSLPLLTAKNVLALMFALPRGYIST